AGVVGVQVRIMPPNVQLPDMITPTSPAQQSSQPLTESNATASSHSSSVQTPATALEGKKSRRAKKVLPDEKPASEKQKKKSSSGGAASPKGSKKSSSPSSAQKPKEVPAPSSTD
ncbi:MAG: hypothetical protein QW594_02675, partial [Candidatus Woesearchaeota archaeon]